MIDTLDLDAWHKCAVSGCAREVPWKYETCPFHSPIRNADWPWRLTDAWGGTRYGVVTFSGGDSEGPPEAA